MDNIRVFLSSFFFLLCSLSQFCHSIDTLTKGQSIRDDVATGNYTLGVDPRGAPQIIIWEHRKRRWRSGQWNSVIFTGVPETAGLASFLYGFRLSPRESDGSMYFTYNPANPSDLLRFRIGWDGLEEQQRWIEGNKSWSVMQRQPENDCELYNHCGDFGVCNKLESPKCRCMDGFVPKHMEQWNRGNWSDGCVRRTKLQCERNSSVAGQNGGGKGGFKRFKCMKLPDSADVLPLGQSESCEERCLQNCSCTAYAEITGIGCMIWSGNLVDVQEFNKDPSTLMLHIRLADSELGGKRAISYAVIIVVVVVGSFVLAISAWLFWRFKGELEALCKDSPISCCKSSNVKITDPSSREFSTDLSGPSEGFIIDGSQVNSADLPMYNFNAVAAATDNFSEENKLGQGGFGPVYKGKLPGGQEIAVKRLSRKSGQEKMLLYEYMPNKSLDFFLFDPEKQGLLDWTKRFLIIEGIARGLLVVGTYGYMSPEYAMEGLFSVKSDVYSFGVLLLEIVTGRRNTSFRTSDYSSLIGYAWQLWNEGKAMDLIDPKIWESRSFVDNDYFSEVQDTSEVLLEAKGASI
ncbi:hypothetical protein QYF36_022465 [Acer negundo]|nr:hypothetical protein QYF36_022465 [Acer negundo]